MFLSKALKMDCKQVIEAQRNCIYSVVFGNKFHQLPKLSGSTSLEMQNNAAAATEDKEEEMVETSEEAKGLLKPSQHPSHRRVKSLKEMPGPKTFSNLMEFFCKDGFARIHEIQVQFNEKQSLKLIIFAFCCTKQFLRLNLVFSLWPWHLNARVLLLRISISYFPSTSYSGFHIVCL